ncbi:MCTP1 [Symbiodinium natans]|uniref:MCTP1 protein n=1 Tax=Symbiodinium natans TaxID=878477 RepID=A0A812PPM1_9DINO|nr:MCTP1 [Symbiodinium natans]
MGGRQELAWQAVQRDPAVTLNVLAVRKLLKNHLAHIQRLGVYFGLKGLKGKIRYKLYEERVALLVTATPEKRNRIAFGLLDVGGDGVVGRRDVFAALAAARSEDTAYNESIDAVFTSPGAYGVHFADSDTPSLLVVGVVPASPAEHQGVRVGHRLSRINGISVDKLTTQEVRTLLMNPSRPLSMTFRYRPSPEATDGQQGVPNGIIDLRDLKRLLEALSTDCVTRRVKIYVASAKNLKAVEQHLGKSDPYCQVEVEGKPRTRWQTKALTESLDPDWREEREIADFAIGETLRFTVRDKDFGTKEDDILGIATLPSHRFQEKGFEGDLILYEENMQRKTNSILHVRVNLSGEGGIGISDFEKVFHDGEPLFLRQLQEVLTGVTQKRKDYATEPVKLKVTLISATGLRSAETAPSKADSYCTCEIAGRTKYQRLQTKTATDSLDPVWNEKKEVVDYLPGEALRFAIHDSDQGRSSQVDELLGSCVMPSSQFWPGGFDGEVTLTQEEQSRRDKKSTVTLKLKVTTPESAAPHQFASAAKPPEPGGHPGSALVLERFEAEMKELRARLPFLKEADFSWHMRVFEALRDEDWLIQRARLVASADKIFGIPVGDIAGRLFEAVSPRMAPVGILEWAQFLERYRNGDWDSSQERIHLTFALYDLDGDGVLSLADAISLSREVERLELILWQGELGHACVRGDAMAVWTHCERCGWRAPRWAARPAGVQAAAS